MANLGNPAPLGLLCFGMTTMMLMYIDMGWCESEFEELVAGYAIFYGGFAQLLVGIFELIKGATFPFAVFGSYAAFWLGWGLTVIETHRSTSEFTGDYTDGKTLWLIQWGILTLCFWIIALRKNMCLIITLGLLWITFFLLAAATSTGNQDVKKAGGYFGFVTAIAAWYTAMAEIAADEYGKHVLPGLKPMLTPERIEITKENMKKRIDYDSKTNTMFLQFRNIQIKTTKDITQIQAAVEEVIKQSNGGNKVHVIVDYEGAVISDDIFISYWNMVSNLEKTYYLSAKRFHVTSFGTGSNNNNNEPQAIGMRKIADNWSTDNTSTPPTPALLEEAQISTKE